MSNRKYDELMRALIPKQPTGPTHGQHPTPYPGPTYQPTGPYYHGNAPIQYPQYPRMEPYYPPVEPGPVMPVMPRPKPEKKGMTWLDLAVVLFVAAMGIIFLAAALPN